MMKKIFILCLTILMAFSVCPVSAWTVTSPFGWRHHPITGEYTFHSGVDIAAEQGTPIGAVFAGETAYAGQWKGYGNVVVLKHSEDVYTLCSQRPDADITVPILTEAILPTTVINSEKPLTFIFITL